MAQINLPNVRQESDLQLIVQLKDNNVAVDWTSLTGIRAFAYSDGQKVLAAELQAEVDAADHTKLVVDYAGALPQYLGVCRLVVRGTYSTRQKTFDKPVVNFVAQTAQATGVTAITDPVVDVTLSVQEVSTSLLDAAISAAIDAAAKANSSAEHQPIIDQTNKHWKIWNPSTGAYVDSGIVAEGQDGEDGQDGSQGPTGPQGPAGPAGTLNYPTFNITAAMHLTATSLTQGDVSRFDIADGHLKLTI